MIKTNILNLLKSVDKTLTTKGFLKIDSPGLLQPKFGYPFSPSAGHHFIDSVVVSKKEPHEVQKFSVLPDRSLRMYDVEKIGISSRHLSFFETIVFGYVGAAEKLPKQDACRTLFDLYCALNLDPKNLLITTFSNASIEGTNFSTEEDEIFYKSWVNLLGEQQVKRTTGRRNFFYSRKKGNPGGTGCELYYNLNGTFIEIGSQVNYKFVFTGGLERMRNAAILQGFGLERLLMVLEQKTKISDVSTIYPIKEQIKKHLQNLGEDKQTIELYDETLTKIADSTRAISIILLDSNGDINILNHSQKRILDTFKKSLFSEIEYLGLNPFEFVDSLINCTKQIFENRYNLKKTQNQTKKYIIDA